MKKIIIVGVILACIVVSLGVYKNRDAPQPPIRIGAALGLTGECANYGEGELKAVQLAVDEANKSGGISGRQIVLATEDTQCTPKGAINAMRKLIDVDSVEGVVGVTWGDSFQAGYSINESARVAAVSPSTAMEALAYNHLPTKHTFSTWFSERDEINALQKQAGVMHLGKFVVFHDEDAFATMMSSLWKEYAQANGLQTAHEYKVPVGFDDYRTIILKMKADNPDAVVFFAQTQATRAKFMKEAKELGFKVPVFQSADIENPSLLKNYGAAMEGMVYSFPEVTGENTEFLKRFKDFHGTDSVGASDASAYDAARVLIHALREHHEKGTDLVSALEATRMPGTAFSEIRFDAGHQITGSKYVIKTVRKGQFVNW